MVMESQMKESQQEEMHPAVLAKGAVNRVVLRRKVVMFPAEQRVEEEQRSAAQRQWKQLDWQRAVTHQEVQALLRKAMLLQSVKQQQVMVCQWTLELLLPEEYLR